MISMVDEEQSMGEEEWPTTWRRALRSVVTEDFAWPEAMRPRL